MNAICNCVCMKAHMSQYERLSTISSHWYEESMLEPSRMRKIGSFGVCERTCPSLRLALIHRRCWRTATAERSSSLTTWQAYISLRASLCTLGATTLCQETASRLASAPYL